MKEGKSLLEVTTANISVVLLEHLLKLFLHPWFAVEHAGASVAASVGCFEAGMELSDAVVVGLQVLGGAEETVEDGLAWVDGGRCFVDAREGTGR